MRGFIYGKLVRLIRLSYVVKERSVIRAGAAGHREHSQAKPDSHSCTSASHTPR